jgi:putative NADH-flavin reductase
MSIKRVFISGATGSNGMTIAQHLKASGLEVICLVRNDSKPEVAGNIIIDCAVICSVFL